MDEILLLDDDKMYFPSRQSPVYNPGMEDYRVRTDAYSGPLDLLLYLIRRDEVDIYDIPVARVTQQYCEYVEMLSVVDPNVAGEFLVLAATLMEIKSRLLLPRPVGEEAEQDDLSDPRIELVRQLLEYKKFKDASFELKSAAEEQSQRWSRSPVKLRPPDPSEVDLNDVQIWDLIAAFNKVMSSIGAGQVTHDVVYDDTPISLHAADILDRLQREGETIKFEQIFTGRKKAEMIGLFLALLELMRQQRVRIMQENIFGSIVVNLLSAEPIQVGEEWGPTFSDAVLGGDESTSSTTEEESADAPPTLSISTGEEDTSDDDDDTDEEELEGFDDLKNIKVDVDIDAILKQETPSENESV